MLQLLLVAGSAWQRQLLQCGMCPPVGVIDAGAQQRLGHLGDVVLRSQLQVKMKAKGKGLGPGAGGKRAGANETRTPKIARRRLRIGLAAATGRRRRLTAACTFTATRTERWACSIRSPRERWLARRGGGSERLWVGAAPPRAMHGAWCRSRRGPLRGAARRRSLETSRTLRAAKTLGLAWVKAACWQSAAIAAGKC